MKSFKHLLFALVLLPLISFAQTYVEKEFANDATFNNVSVGCYSAFKAAFKMLPQLAAQLNEQAGQEVLLISNVNTPMGNPSTYSLTIDKSPTGRGVGDYKLYQKYANNSLYLRIDQMPATLPTDQIDKVWAMVAKGFEACTF